MKAFFDARKKPVEKEAGELMQTNLLSLLGDLATVYQRVMLHALSLQHDNSAGNIQRLYPYLSLDAKTDLWQLFQTTKVLYAIRKKLTCALSVKVDLFYLLSGVEDVGKQVIEHLLMEPGKGFGAAVEKWKVVECSQAISNMVHRVYEQAFASAAHTVPFEAHPDEVVPDSYFPVNMSGQHDLVGLGDPDGVSGSGEIGEMVEACVARGLFSPSQACDSTQDVERDSPCGSFLEDYPRRILTHPGTLDRGAG